jgi:hypothetical protein
VNKGIDIRYTTEAHIRGLAEDPMCYPQLNPHKDLDPRGMTYAQRVRDFIEFTLEHDLEHAENPECIVIY